jgi:undecaprenyl phosphate-alpha-L-ara4FN deformylase
MNTGNSTTLAIKIDVDTARGTAEGVPALLALFKELDIISTFLFSLGPDNTGRAIKRIFNPGFFSKVSRTSILSVYGLRTLLYGTLLKGPHIGKKYGHIMCLAKMAGHEVGIHTYDHTNWQDNLHKMTEPQVRTEVTKCYEAFQKIFGMTPHTMGAAGWQANKKSLAAYDDAGFLYASDTRGTTPFFPKIKRRQFNTLQIPTTLPTLDELLGRQEYPFEGLHDHYLSLIKPNQLNVLTIHTELEGMHYLEWFKNFLVKIKDAGIHIVPLKTLALTALTEKAKVPHSQLIQKEVDGRSGLLACQGEV